jgi:hypothetical protein
LLGKGAGGDDVVDCLWLLVAQEGDDVVDCLWLLVAQEAMFVGVQSVLSPPVCCPMALSQCDPKEDFDL